MNYFNAFRVFLFCTLIYLLRSSSNSWVIITAYIILLLPIMSVLSHLIDIDVNIVQGKNGGFVAEEKVKKKLSVELFRIFFSLLSVALIFLISWYVFAVRLKLLVI